MPLPALAAGLITAAVPSILNTVGGLFGAGQQSNRNMELAKYQADQNMKMAQFQYANDMRMMQYQNQYNSPAAQMGRYEAAGLNKNLVYGQGSPGNMQQAPRYPDLKYPDIKTADYQSAFAGLGTQLLQNQLLAAQANLTENKADESGVKRDLMRAQKALIEANPYLNAGYVESFVANMEATAALKKMAVPFTEIMQQKAIEKITEEIALLDQKFKLGTQDAQIKAQIIQSKEYQNALQAIQVKWMSDGELNAEHIRLGVMMLLGKWK